MFEIVDAEHGKLLTGSAQACYNPADRLCVLRICSNRCQTVLKRPVTEVYRPFTLTVVRAMAYDAGQWSAGGSVSLEEFMDWFLHNQKADESSAWKLSCLWTPALA